HDLVLSGAEVDHDPPVSPGPRAEVLEQLRLRPGRPTVERDVDPRDVPLPARERVTAHLDRADRDRLAVGRRQHVGVERDQAERHPCARARRPVLRQQPVYDVLEVSLPRPRANLDPLEPLDTARADAAGHDYTQRRAVDEWHWLTI